MHHLLDRVFTSLRVSYSCSHGCNAYINKLFILIDGHLSTRAYTIAYLYVYTHIHTYISDFFV